MSNFKIVKKGYSQLEVDSYIERLKNDYESRLAEQKDRIFYLKDQVEKLTNSTDNELMFSLLSAVERARLIENSSKNIYELETKKLSLLYQKMENLLNNENFINMDIKKELLSTIQDCKISLQNNLEMQKRHIKENSSGDPVKRLLSKMLERDKNYSTNNRKEVDNVLKEQRQTEVENTPIVHIRRNDIKKNEVETRRADNKEFNQFLNNNISKINGTNFESIMFSNNDLSPNESGFDLKEAVNPKEDLEEIMKAFDFYNDARKEAQ